MLITAELVRAMLRILTNEAAARRFAEVLHSCPPGVDKIGYLQALMARVESGRATYADRIILEGCDVRDLRAVLDLLDQHQKKAAAQPRHAAGPN